MEDKIFHNATLYTPNTADNVRLDMIQVIEKEEDVELGFNPENYLPANFNALAGKNDIALTDIEIFEIEEEASSWAVS